MKESEIMIQPFTASDQTPQIGQMDYMAELKKELAINSQHSAALMRAHMQSTMSIGEASSRQQLESMLMHAERALSNEESSRALSKLFGKFSLLNKIMQSMG